MTNISEKLVFKNNNFYYIGQVTWKIWAEKTKTKEKEIKKKKKSKQRNQNKTKEPWV